MNFYKYSVQLNFLLGQVLASLGTYERGLNGPRDLDRVELSHHRHRAALAN